MIGYWLNLFRQEEVTEMTDPFMEMLFVIGTVGALFFAVLVGLMLWDRKHPYK
jgi:hypothetical protein